MYRLERVQHSAACFIHCVSKHDCVDTDDLLHDLNWLPIRFRIDFKIAVIAFKSMNGQAPGYIDALLRSDSRNQSLRSHNQDLLLVPKTTFLLPEIVVLELLHQKYRMPFQRAYVTITT